jgi:hypothetical protein
VLKLVADGDISDEVAELVVHSRRTVDRHRANMLENSACATARARLRRDLPRSDPTLESGSQRRLASEPTSAARLSWSSWQAGQPSRCACIPGTAASGELELDVAVEVLEALLAGQLGAHRSQQSSEQVGGWRDVAVAHGVAPSRTESTASPSAASRALSLRRASWRGL